MDGFVVGLLAVLVLPPLLVGGFLRWFWRLSRVADKAAADQLPRARRLGLLAIACVTSLVFYGWLDTVTQPIGTPHGPSTSISPQHHYATLGRVLILGAGVGLLLALQPRRRAAALYFGSGLLLALGGAGGGWYLYFAHEKQVYQARMVDYALVARTDSLQRLPNGFYGRRAGGSATDPRSDEEIPTFPGGEPALYQAIQERINYQALTRKYPLDKEVEVQVEFIVETDGRITCAHVSEHHSFACDAEAVRVLNSLPRYRPGLQKGRPIAASWYTSVLFQRRGAAKP
ncbi:energy transducer TonB [Hymenobacter bucti]|uniref:Energy transducer TonB n=1 Tax=Hymenobacter bucti TaxID=1844114 RepID=A0ABW4QNP5_9BACT